MTAIATPAGTPRESAAGGRPAVRRFVAAGLLLAAGLAVPAGAEGGERRSFVLNLDGRFSEFVMYCDIVDAAGSRRVKRRDWLPHAYRFEAEALACTVNLLAERGNLRAELFEGKRIIARAVQNAVRPVVSVRSDGPWGAASGSRTVNQPIRP